MSDFYNVFSFPSLYTLVKYVQLLNLAIFSLLANPNQVS